VEERAGVAYNGIDPRWIACRQVAAASIRAALVITAGHGRRGPGSVGKRDMKNRANAHLSLRAAAATKYLPGAAASNTRFLWREKSSLTVHAAAADTRRRIRAAGGKMVQGVRVCASSHAAMVHITTRKGIGTRKYGAVHASTVAPPISATRRRPTGESTPTTSKFDQNAPAKETAKGCVGNIWGGAPNPQ
jgi:hypothetical protein